MAPSAELRCTCRSCGRVYVYDRVRGHTRVRCNSCGGSRAKRAERQALKARMVAYKGGRCSACGYSRSIVAMSFHHCEPEEKAFNIAGSHARSWESLRKELDKCVLLCLNCHLEQHAVDEDVGRQKTRRSETPNEAGRRCTNCGRVYTHDYRQGHTRRLCNSCRSNRGGREARHSLKRRLVEIKGGRCESCGYSRCLRALCFHHVDSEFKRFAIAGSHLRSLETLREELDRCLLLCRNCHAIVHDDLYATRAARRSVH